jgi:hypothetical protein
VLKVQDKITTKSGKDQGATMGHPQGATMGHPQGQNHYQKIALHARRPHILIMGMTMPR